MTRSPPTGLVQEFRRRFGRQPSVLARAPGRVDLLGAHVDYNEGHILALAVDRHVWVAAARAEANGLTTVVALDLQDETAFEIGHVGSARDVDGLPLAAWARYPAGVAWALDEVGAVGAAAPCGLPALDAMVTGDVPVGGGVSSSAALEVAFAFAWLALADRMVAPLDVAAACRRAENDYVGVACGLMDQYCAVFGRAGRALLLDCRSLQHTVLPLPEAAVLVLADTGTRRQLADGALNARHTECEQAVDALGKSIPGLTALRDVSADKLDALAATVPEPALSRARHIVAEEARVLDAADALAAGDARRLGILMDRSHESSRDLYAASGPAIDAMWAAGRDQDGYLGGRFIGAGFAGCVLFLVSAGSAPGFIEAAGRDFEQSTGLRPAFQTIAAAEGARVCR